MKVIAVIPLLFALSASSLANAQLDDMKNIDMKGMEMKDMGNKPQTNESKSTTHQMKAVVKAVDMAKGKVTLAHEPVKSLNWPAMTMGFSVRDKALFDNLPVGKKIQVEFIQQGSDYIVIGVK
jgi:Cu(I)/Ag(I) efflux system periplasmic protein CusF